MKRKPIYIIMLICILASLVTVKERLYYSINARTCTLIMGIIYLVFFGCMFALFVIDDKEDKKEPNDGNR